MTRQVLLSSCIGLPVRGPGGRSLGRVADLEADPRPAYPRVRAVRVRDGAIPWPDVLHFGPELVDVATAPVARDSRGLLLRRDVFDAQVVDLAGRRLARVGDVELVDRDGQLEAVAVDVGLAPVLRRLGLGPIARRLAEEWIPWPGIYLASSHGHRLQLEHRAEDVHRLNQAELEALIGRLPPARGGEVLALARPEAPDPHGTARRARRPRRFPVMRARKRAPS